MSWRRRLGKRRLAAVLIGAVLLGLAWRGYRAVVGDPEAELGASWHEGHRIVDRDGALLRELPTSIGARGRSLPLDAMGDRLVVATLASEDARFYEHGGVDGRAVLRAVAQNLRHRRIVSGASTITQQLVKLLDTEGKPPGERRDLEVKVREAARAQNLEASLDKPAILEAYLNRLSYGRGLVGPATAAEAYFGVSPRDLSWAQASFLAVLPRAPSHLDPYRHPERGRKRQRVLLAALLEDGLLSEADYQRAIAEPIEPLPMRHPFAAPHLTEALVAGAHGGLSEGTVTHTTLDGALQRDLEGLVDTHRTRLLRAEAKGAAVVVIDNTSGEVLAYVGNADFAEASAGQVDMVRALRQPGSTLKPFVYALAFERGLQPAALLADVPTRFGERDGSYAPKNFDGRFLGPIPAREALAGSLNVPAVRLMSELPRGALLDRLRALGVTSLERDADHYGLALALGSGEVSLLELAGAYVALARGGRPIALRVTGEAAAKDAGEPVIDPAAVAAVSDALSDPVARIRGLGGRGPFDIGFPVAVKTGTSSGYRDTWAVGYTHERTVAVWVGNADGAPTHELTGGSGAGPLFADAMRRAMRDIPVRAPLWDAALLGEAYVCPLSGKPAGPACPERVARRFIPEGDTGDGHHASDEPCTLHRHARRVASRFRCDLRGRETVVVFPEAFSGWLASQPLGAPGWDPQGLPWLPESTAGCASGAVPHLSVVSPSDGAVAILKREGEASEQLEIVAALRGLDDAALPVEVLLDGVVVAQLSPPYRTQVPARRGDHIIEVRSIDPDLPLAGGRSRISIR
ncbi:MAG: penicillin-binding protein 1C [Myxococcales bacterium]|nr:penicillin-binding protein 1C [Myxococcales bacterium]